jgi:hypothetical protein
MPGYTKYSYWIEPHLLDVVKKYLQEKETPLTDEAHIPCRALRASKEIVFILPKAWTGICKRKTSWYWKSGKAEKCLVIANEPLEVSGVQNPILITESDFKPDRLPSSEETMQLTHLQEYRRRKPPEWEKIDPPEIEFYERWFHRLEGKGHFDFDEIFVSQSANHANFLDPRFFVMVNGARAPYSIADSTRVCSSCLEFFNILGAEWPVKYVVPCAGAVQFARLPMNQHFKVETT